MIRPVLAILSAAALGLTACEQPGAAPAPVATAETPGVSGARIAYVNSDSILANYAYLSGQSQLLQRRQEDASAELERDLRKFQEQVQSFQRRAQSGNLTPKQIEDEQTFLARREQELSAEQQRLAGEFQGEGLRIQNEVATVLQREVEAIRTAEGYDYVLQYGAASPVLAVNEAFDITDAVLARMNAAGPPEGED